MISSRKVIMLTAALQPSRRGCSATDGNVVGMACFPKPRRGSVGPLTPMSYAGVAGGRRAAPLRLVQRLAQRALTMAPLAYSRGRLWSGHDTLLTPAS